MSGLSALAVGESRRMTRRPRFNTADIVDAAEIARRADVAVTTVYKWKQRHPSFPEPIQDLSVGPIYWWPEVQKWLQEREKTSG